MYIVLFKIAFIPEIKLIRGSELDLLCGLSGCQDLYLGTHGPELSYLFCLLARVQDDSSTKEVVCSQSLLDA
jgi:hypothetical protein